MSVNLVSSSYSSYSQYLQLGQSGQSGRFQQRKQDFNALSSALSSGDITSAQSAFATLQKDMPKFMQGSGVGTSQNGSQNSAMTFGNALSSARSGRFQQRKQDFNALATALSSGDITSAKSAFATLQKDMPNLSQSQTGQQTTQNTLQNDITALQTALTAGDSTGIQTALSTLKQDSQNIGQSQDGQQAGQTHHRHHHHHHYQTNDAQSNGTVTAATLSNVVKGSSVNIAA
ncbi:MAG: hypothetical protein HQK59_00905 [Deltaproteobacteria bacterium]|nr:hypothetical protein [Deltaproteobacteria bacterium]